MFKLTEAQLKALYAVYLRWQNITPQAIMPRSFEIIPESEVTPGSYFGLWVGTPTKEEPGSIYLGIEADGHTHS